MQMSSPQLTEARDMTSEGQAFIMGTGGRLNAGDTLVVNLSGMPAHSHMPRNVALAAAALVFVVGLWMAMSPAAAPRLGRRQARERAANECLPRSSPSSASGSRRRSRRRRRRACERLTSDLEKILAALDLGPKSGDGVATA